LAKAGDASLSGASAASSAQGARDVVRGRSLRVVGS
jgi:hypothetical protein